MIARLHEGGEAARAALERADELLRRYLVDNYASYLDEVNAEDISPEDFVDLRDALYHAFRHAGDERARREFLFAAAHRGDERVKAELVRELHLVLEIHRTASWVLWDALLALEGLGEDVYPHGGGRGIDSVEKNIKAAHAYLRRHGLVVPF